MFSSLRLRNFKCYQGPTGDIPLRPLTLIVGANNAGKSTLIQSMLVIKQTLADRSQAPRLVAGGPWVDLGGFHDILHAGHMGAKGTFSIGLTRDEPDQVVLQEHRSKGERELTLADRVDITFAFDSKRRDIVVRDVSLCRGDEIQAEVSRRGASWRARGVSEAAKKRLNVELVHFFPQIMPRGIGQGHKFKMQGLRRAWQTAQTLNIMAWVWEKLFSNMAYIAPLRKRMPWYSRVGDAAGSEVGVGGGSLLQALATEKNLLINVGEWMSERGQILKGLRLQPLDSSGVVQSAMGDDVSGCENINLAAMGEGIAQMLPIVARTLSTKPKQCVLVEQPELHLHPSAQAELADLFIENMTQRQFIIETHSEHLLLRVRRRVAEGSLSPDDVAVLYVEKRAGGSRVRQLQMNGQGHFDDWPDGFFEDGYREAMALAMAGMEQD